MSNIAPIRTTAEINTIINNARITLAALGAEIVNEEMQDITTNNTLHRDKVYRLLLIDIYLTTILDKNGNVLNFFLSSTNTLKFNKILTGLLNLANMSGPAIPLLLQKINGLQFFPVASGSFPGGMIFVSFWDASSGAFPTVGTLSSGGIAKGNFFINSTAGNMGGEDFRPGSAMMATIDNPGQTLVNWYVLF